MADMQFDFEPLAALRQATREEHNEAPHNIETVEPEEDFIPLLDDTDPSAPSTEEQKLAACPTGRETSASRLVELPWKPASSEIKSPSLRLHNEIVEFTKFLQPTSYEHKLREAAIKRVTRLVVELFPHAEVKVFGSYATGLYLPTSDMDLVIIGSGCKSIPRGLRAIAASLFDKSMATNIQVIAKARVPIIKFTDTKTDFRFDISFDVENGPQAAEYIRNLITKMPSLRHLTVVLKLFLQQRDMNEVYGGGIGSYALTVMIAAFLRQHSSSRPDNPPLGKPSWTNLGLLLMDFFRLYGRLLNSDDVGVSCTGSGVFFRKEERGFSGRERHLLAIQDPRDPHNDLGKGSFNYWKVQQAFEYAYQQLSGPSWPHESQLARIIRPDPELMARAAEASGETPIFTDESEDDGDAPPAKRMRTEARTSKPKASKGHSKGKKKFESKSKQYWNSIKSRRRDSSQNKGHGSAQR